MFQVFVDQNNFLKDTENRKIHWLKIREVRTESKNPGILFFRYDFNEEFRQINVVKQPNAKYKAPPLQKQKDGISAEKKKDLISLVKSGVVPKQHEMFFKSLRCAQDKETVEVPEKAKRIEAKKRKIDQKN